ncbi:MAG: hypothetical protein HZB70_04175 [Candidatus Berkelbacteria bacterium]|nr:MAG: hypothetical protein HZB70_04175 [Candidatus Berkelbacteria bacterium]QQG51505.1 MAG: hypothetical protein HY845_03015 [Candidatus Berkelbacteria bacterium]
MKKIWTLVVLSALLLTGCGGNTTKAQRSSWEGSWSNGDADTGTISFNIRDNQRVEGSAYCDFLSQYGQVVGTTNAQGDLDLRITFPSLSVHVFGRVERYNGTARGTVNANWSNQQNTIWLLELTMVDYDY